MTDGIRPRWVGGRQGSQSGCPGGQLSAKIYCKQLQERRVGLVVVVVVVVVVHRGAVVRCGGPVFFGAGNSTRSRARFPPLYTHQERPAIASSSQAECRPRSPLFWKSSPRTPWVIGTKTRLVELVVSVMRNSLPPTYHVDHRSPISNLA